MTLRKYFDKVIIINLIDRKDRKKNIIDQIMNFGLIQDYEDGVIEFHDAVRIPCINEGVVKYMDESDSGHFFSLSTGTYNVGLCNCSIEHYRVIKCAYEKGYEKILVLEDDISFIKDADILKRCFESIPNGYDFLHFEGFYWPVNDDEKNYVKSVLSEDPSTAFWRESADLRIWDAGAIAYSREGMRKYLYNQESMPMQFSDFYNFHMDENSYFYTYPVSIQKPMIFSDITEENSGVADYNAYLTYVNKENYF